MKRCLLIVILSFCYVIPIYADTLPIFPGAEGFGAETRAAYGGSGNPMICIVNTLTDNSNQLINGIRNGIPVKTGSLRSCLTYDSGNNGKIILFEVSGIIDLTQNGWIKVKFPYLIVAGQSAPQPGIIIKGAPIRIFTHDVLIQHIRTRIGDDPNGPNPEYRDAFYVGYDSYNVVIDHCSFSWAIDGNIDITSGDKPISNITVSSCIISEGLVNSLHPEGNHSTGMAISKSVENVSLIRNLFAHNQRRNPICNYTLTNLLMVNNIIYNWSGVALNIFDKYGPSDGQLEGSVVGNLFIPGKNTSSGDWAIRIYEGRCKLHVDDNQGPHKNGNDEWSIVKDTSGFQNYVATPPVWVSGLSVLESNEVKEFVLNNVGARPADRDAVDERIIEETSNITGQMIDSQNEVGGWPVLVHKTHTLMVPKNPNSDNDKDGYTNLEEWLHKLASSVEKNFAESSISIPKNVKSI